MFAFMQKLRPAIPEKPPAKSNAPVTFARVQKCAALPPAKSFLFMNTPHTPADFNLFPKTSSTVVHLNKASIALLILALLLAACDRSDQQIKVYRVAKAPLE